MSENKVSEHTQEAWGVVAKCGTILTAFVRATKTETIKALCGDGEGWRSRLAYWKKQGHRITRLHIWEAP